MTTVHNPPESIGDCFRCCIASILELPAAEVPHVYEDEGWFDETGRVGMKRLRDWLASQGLYYFEFELAAEYIANWKGAIACHYIISGVGSRGVRHVCVGRDGEIVHDPHPSRTGIEPEDGKYLLGFICKL